MDNLASIVQQLQQEHARIDAALQALTGVSKGHGTARTRRSIAVQLRLVSQAETMVLHILD